jgi:hypothetical protein
MIVPKEMPFRMMAKYATARLSRQPDGARRGPPRIMRSISDLEFPTSDFRSRISDL